MVAEAGRLLIKPTSLVFFSIIYLVILKMYIRIVKTHASIEAEKSLTKSLIGGKVKIDK